MKKAFRYNLYSTADGVETLTVDVAFGVTPHIIICPTTGREARSANYDVAGRIKRGATASHEWYRPTDSELNLYDEDTQEFIAGGGLLLRPRTNVRALRHNEHAAINQGNDRLNDRVNLRQFVEPSPERMAEIDAALAEDSDFAEGGKAYDGMTAQDFFEPENDDEPPIPIPQVVLSQMGLEGAERSAAIALAFVRNTEALEGRTLDPATLVASAHHYVTEAFGESVDANEKTLAFLNAETPTTRERALELAASRLILAFDLLNADQSNT